MENLSGLFWQDTIAEAFIPPSDSLGREHTLGRLFSSAAIDGTVKKSPDRLHSHPFMERVYTVQWAPVVCRVAQSPFNNFPHSARIDVADPLKELMPKDSFLIYSISYIDGGVSVALGSSEDWFPKADDIKIYDGSTSAIARRRIWSEFTVPFFDQFKGWVEEGGIWVPPSPGAQEPADAS